MKASRNLLFLAMTALPTLTADAELYLPAVISDHMVLQADAPAPIWGQAAPGAPVELLFNAQVLKTKADDQGFWQIQLKPLKSQAAGLEMTLREGTNAPVVIHDVLVGEVWLACGQSNMAYPLSAMEGKEEYLEKAKNTQIRYFSVAKKVSAEPLGLRPGLSDGDLVGKWVISDATTAANFSAVGVLFAEELQTKLQRPVGIIGSNWGGTTIQLWMSTDAFGTSPIIKDELTRYRAAVERHRQVSFDPDAEAKYKQVFDQWQTEVGKAHDEAMAVWNKSNDAGKDAGPRPPLSEPEPRNPDPIGTTYGSERPATPATGFNAMISPLIPFAVKGALWYQGEANVSHWQQYGDLLRAMVVDWRTRWNEPELHFYVVQLPANGKNREPRDLPHLREAQASVLSLPHTAIAVGMDVGSPGNVHPRSKVAVSHRLALDAFGEAYGLRVPFLGPRLTSIVRKNNSLVLNFDSDGGALTIGQAPWLAPDGQQFPKDHLVGFEIAGTDNTFVSAKAQIQGNTVVLRAEGVSAPTSVRYAWDQSPQANLYDSAGLPAMPFRSSIATARPSSVQSLGCQPHSV